MGHANEVIKLQTMHSPAAIFKLRTPIYNHVSCIMAVAYSPKLLKRHSKTRHGPQGIRLFTSIASNQHACQMDSPEEVQVRLTTKRNEKFGYCGQFGVATMFHAV